MQHLGNDTIIDYLHRELAPGEDAAVLMHLEACADCSVRLNLESAIGGRLRAQAKAEELDLPLGMREAIMARIAAEAAAPTPWERLAAWLRPAVVVPVVAAAALAAVLIPMGTQHAAAPTLPVMYYLEEHAAHAQENPLADRSATVMMTSLERTASTETVPMMQAVNAASLVDSGAR
ncbi:MAG: zf-HC2 domain-containing protein [Candidatus Eremiobacteraeota bacterium]|nr:zf-HC2 domain-containing protein [Candidatus Eremiobacteraeota bacterium]